MAYRARCGPIDVPSLAVGARYRGSGGDPAPVTAAGSPARAIPDAALPLSRTGPRQAAVPSEQLLSPWAEQIERWLQPERLQVTRIHELLAERGCEVSYSTLRRFIARRGNDNPFWPLTFFPRAQ